MRKPGHSIRSEFKSELAKLKEMTFTEKVSYIVTYYKHWFFIFLILCLVGYYVGDIIVQAGKETVLVGFFPNDEWDLFGSSRLEDDYRAAFPLEDNQNVYFEDNLYVDLEGNATEYTTTSNSKIMAYQANQDLDFLLTPDYLFDHYAESLPMYDFRDLLPEDLVKELEPYFVYSEYEGTTGAYGLDMTQCRYIAGAGAGPEERPEIEDTYILFVPITAPRTDALVDYIHFLFDWQ